MGQCFDVLKGNGAVGEGFFVWRGGQSRCYLK